MYGGFGAKWLLLEIAANMIFILIFLRVIPDVLCTKVNEAIYSAYKCAYLNAQTHKLLSALFSHFTGRNRVLLRQILHMLL